MRGELIEGPCRCVDELLKAAKADSIKDLVDSPSFDVAIDTPWSVMKVRESSFTLAPDQIVRTPRIGLTLKAASRCSSATNVPKEHIKLLRELFVFRRYRYIREDASNLIKKGKHFRIIWDSEVEKKKPKLAKTDQANIAAFEKGRQTPIAKYWEANFGQVGTQCEVFGSLFQIYGESM
jgi:hypothetical protein